MSPEWKHLTSAAVKAIHAEVLAAHGGAGGRRDDGLPESAVAVSRATSGGAPLMTAAVAIAAAYLFYLCRNHPCVDGNQRTALAACLVFLEANRLLPKPKLAVDGWEALVRGVAAPRLDRAATTKWRKKLRRA